MKLASVVDWEHIFAGLDRYLPRYTQIIVLEEVLRAIITVNVDFSQSIIQSRILVSDLKAATN